MLLRLELVSTAWSLVEVGLDLHGFLLTGSFHSALRQFSSVAVEILVVRVLDLPVLANRVDAFEVVQAGIRAWRGIETGNTSVSSVRRIHL